MRVGVIVGRLSPEEGGGHFFRSCLLHAINTCSGSHTFILLDPWSSECQQPTSGSTGETLTTVPGRLERRIRETNVDIVWFLTPDHMPAAVPYITTVWDLQHRCQPFFPEVSITGWKWEDREHRYRSSLPRATRVITGTQVGKDEVVRFYGVPAENVRVVRLPSPQAAAAESDAGSKVRKKYGIDGKYLFYPAHFWPHKNHVNLLLALDVLRRSEGLDLDLVLTGADQGNRK